MSFRWVLDADKKGLRSEYLNQNVSITMTSYCEKNQWNEALYMWMKRAVLLDFKCQSLIFYKTHQLLKLFETD